MPHDAILFVIDTLNTGGAEKSLLDILSRFRQFRPIICHVYPGEELASEYRARGVEVISLNIPLNYHILRAARALRAVMEKYKPSIVHSTLWRADVICRLALIGKKIPLVNSFVNNSYHASRYKNASPAQRIKLYAVQAIDAITAPRADLFISNSRAIMESNCRALRILEKKVRVVYRGRSFDYPVLTAAERDRVRRENHWDGRKIFLNVGRLLDRKGQLDLIKAFAELQNEGARDCLLLVAGEGPFRPNLEKEIVDKGLGGSVVLLGNRTDVFTLLQIADYFIFPSHYEGLPGALIEAMIARIPIIASSIPENLECVNAGSAHLFEAGSVPDLQRAIGAAIQSIDANSEKTSQAYSEALEKFDLNRIAESYEGIYKQLLSQRVS